MEEVVEDGWRRDYNHEWVWYSIFSLILFLRFLCRLSIRGSRSWRLSRGGVLPREMLRSTAKVGDGGNNIIVLGYSLGWRQLDFQLRGKWEVRCREKTTCHTRFWIWVQSSNCNTKKILVSSHNTKNEFYKDLNDYKIVEIIK